MKLRQLVSSILAIATVSMSSLTLASPPLTIDNRTDCPSTTKSNNGPCSSLLAGGVTNPQSVNVVSGSTIRAACLMNLENCDSQVYVTANCTGDSIARVIFSVTTGIKEIKPEAGSKYCIKGSGFSVILAPKDSETCRSQ